MDQLFSGDMDPDCSAGCVFYYVERRLSGRKSQGIDIHNINCCQRDDDPHKSFMERIDFYGFANFQPHRQMGSRRCDHIYCADFRDSVFTTFIPVSTAQCMGNPDCDACRDGYDYLV